MITSEERYWERRYSSGGTSGARSVGDGKKWKWSIVDKYVPSLNNVLDVGCGDLYFWEGRDCGDYTGLDVSKTIIEKNIKKHPGWVFTHRRAESRIEGLKKEVVVCFNVLFHIMSTETYTEILRNLCYYSSDYIFVNNWIENPFTKKYQIKKCIELLLKFEFRRSLIYLRNVLIGGRVTDGKYQYYRSLEDDLGIFRSGGFPLVGIERNLSGNDAIYVFKKGKVSG